MEIEQKQAELVRHFVKKAQCTGGSEAVCLIVDATSHPYLFAFSEILSVPNIVQLKETEYSVYVDLLRLFAHGIWTDYKNNAASLPSLEPDQVRKLKQLTVLTLAETAKVLPYILLMQQLDVSNVRELEDFLINECMYSGIVKGKLDQCRCCFEVQFAAGRDLRPGQLENMIQTLATWLTTSENLLLTIQEKIKWADNMSELDRRHKKEVEEKADEMRHSIQAGLDLRGQQEIVYSESGGVEYEEDRVCPKRRRQHGC